jgi:amino acid permease
MHPVAMGINDSAHIVEEAEVEKQEGQSLEQVDTCSPGDASEVLTHPGTVRGIKSRHAQMIAIGG